MFKLNNEHNTICKTLNKIYFVKYYHIDEKNVMMKNFIIKKLLMISIYQDKLKVRLNCLKKLTSIERLLSTNDLEATILEFIFLNIDKDDLEKIITNV